MLTITTTRPQAKHCAPDLLQNQFENNPYISLVTPTLHENLSFIGVNLERVKMLAKI